MARKTDLATEIEEQLNAYEAARETLVTALRELAGERQEAFDARSQRWQESETGNDAAALIDEINSLADEVEGVDPRSRLDEVG